MALAALISVGIFGPVVGLVFELIARRLSGVTAAWQILATVGVVRGDARLALDGNGDALRDVKQSDPAHRSQQRAGDTARCVSEFSPQAATARASTQ